MVSIMALCFSLHPLPILGFKNWKQKSKLCVETLLSDTPYIGHRLHKTSPELLPLIKGLKEKPLVSQSL